jgi:hypothetical protein
MLFNTTRIEEEKGKIEYYELLVIMWLKIVEIQRI